ncbi:MAG TPA: CehA/McbA family metallohydrolase [Planctomycetota bacterium]|nr:CehA/McbA family metallohydrolase [Planctomycetota bacterium]
MPVTLHNPYAFSNGKSAKKSREKKSRAFWLRGNLHMHTTHSDGRRAPQVTVDDYAKRGYDFIMISDHDYLTPPSEVNSRGMLMIPGNEVSARNVHVLHVNAKERLEPLYDRQKVIDAGTGRDQFIIMNHPNWFRDYNHCSVEQLKTWQGYAGIEIYNGGVEQAPGVAVATDKWDAILSTGRMVWGYANDDSHHDWDVELGWNMVLVRERTVAAVVDALKHGRCYGSTGVKIDSIEVDGSIVTLHAANADRIDVISAYSEILQSVRGSRLTFDAAEVPYNYIRLECFGAHGSKAWTQPFAIQGGQSAKRRKMLLERPVLNVLKVKTLPPLGSGPGGPKAQHPAASAWQKALVHGRFLDLVTAGPAPFQTRVQCLSDGKSILFGIDCDEPHMGTLKCKVTSHGDPSIWADDSVELFIDPAGDGKNYWQIMINANGFACAIRARHPAPLKGMQTRAIHRKDGWRVEFLAPLAALGVPADLSTVRFNMGRTRLADGRLARANSSWKWIGETFHAPEHFGLLRFGPTR